MEIMFGSDIKVTRVQSKAEAARWAKLGEDKQFHGWNVRVEHEFPVFPQRPWDTGCYESDFDEEYYRDNSELNED